MGGFLVKYWVSGTPKSISPKTLYPSSKDVELRSDIDIVRCNVKPLDA